MGFRLNGLTEAVTSVFDDLFHLRTTGGIDKKITLNNLRQSIISFEEASTDFFLSDSETYYNKIRAFRNATSSSITITLGTSGITYVMLPGEYAELVYTGYNWYVNENHNQNLRTIDSVEFAGIKLNHSYYLPVISHITGAVGNAFSLGTVDFPIITQMSSSRVAFFDNTLERLETYDWDGTDFTKEGNTFTITGAGPADMVALDSTHIAIAYYRAAGCLLETYFFNGTDWSKIGNSFSLTTGASYAMAKMSSTRVAIHCPTNILGAYDWDGTDWSLVGNGKSIPTNNSQDMCLVAPNTVLLASTGSGGMKAYEFDGIDWTNIASKTNTYGNSGIGLFPLGGGYFGVIENSVAGIEIWHYDSESYEIYKEYTYSLANTWADIDLLTFNKIVVINKSDMTMKAYKFQTILKSNLDNQ